MFDTSFFSNVKEWLADHQRNLLLLVGFVVVGGLMFESGYLRGKMLQSDPLIISIPALPETPSVLGVVSPVVASVNGAETPSLSAQTGQTSCPLVGSRNSDKYHLATCAVVKRIKPENRVCFVSKEDAEKRGYVAGCLK